MNKNMLKRVHLSHKISIVCLAVSLILVEFGVKASEYIFWISVVYNFYEFIMFMMKWSKEGRTISKKCDSNYNKNLTRKSSDYIFFMVIAYGIMVCLPFFTNIFIKDYAYDVSTIFAQCMAFVVCNVALFYVVDRTSNEVIRLEKDRKDGRRYGNKKD